MAAHRVECDLNGLDMLGAPSDFLTTPRALMKLTERLTIPGGLARWAAKFVPITEFDADEEKCNPEPWAHVSEEARQNACDGLTQHSPDRVRPVCR